MKTLFMTLALLTVAVACNKSAETKYGQKQEEVKKEYREVVNEAAKDSREEMKDANEDYQDAQKEEAKDYLEESKKVNLDKERNRIDVDEVKDQD